MPALVLIPLLLVLPQLVHGGGWELVGQFAMAAVQPSLDPVVIQSVISGLGTTVSMALLGWAGSMVLGVGLGVASSRTVWRTVLGHGAPAELIRKLLAIPARSMSCSGGYYCSNWWASNPWSPWWPLPSPSVPWWPGLSVT